MSIRVLLTQKQNRLNKCFTLFIIDLGMQNTAHDFANPTSILYLQYPLPTVKENPHAYAS